MERSKRICVTLKKLRKRIADANGIPYVIEDCPNDGPCPGTCPKCEADVRYLEIALDEKRERGEKVIIEDLMSEEELTLYVNNQECSDHAVEPHNLSDVPELSEWDGLRWKAEPPVIMGIPSLPRDLPSREVEPPVLMGIPSLPKKDVPESDELSDFKSKTPK